MNIPFQFNRAPSSYNFPSLLVLIFSVMVFSGYSLRGMVPYNFEMIFVFIVLGTFYLIWRHKKVECNNYLWVYTAIVLFFTFTISLIANLVHLPADVTQQKMAFLALFPGFLIFVWFIYQVKPNVDYFWFFLLIASVVIVAWGVAEIYIVGVDGVAGGFRVGDYFSNPIKFGVYANGLFILMLGGLIWAYKKHPIMLILWVCFLFTNLAMVILSQTRTAWIGWPEAMIGWGTYYLFLLLKTGLSKLSKFVIILLPLVIFLLISKSPLYHVMEERLGLAVEDVSVYLDGSNYNTSIGIRFVMYEAAIEMIKEKPWVGHGADRFKDVFRNYSINVLNERFGISFSGFKFSHVHNQFLMTWVQYGFFAFLGLVTFFSFLLFFFVKGIKTSAEQDKPMFIAGLVFTVATLLAFMPESPLEFAGYSAHYLLFLSLIFGFALTILSKAPLIQNNK